MLSNRNFLEHEIPYMQLEKLGISKEGILAAQKEVMDNFMTGGFTPLLQIGVEGNDHIFYFLGKLRMSRDSRGGVSLDVLPMRTKTPYDRELNLDEAEMEHLRKGLILKKNVYADNKKITYYAQLDGETNAILKVKARDVAIPSVIKDVDIDRQQRESIREGLPVEIEADGTTYTIGIDLLESTGYKVMQGTEDDWNATVAKEWDRINPGEIGFWLTDENGWQYQELQDSNLKDIEMEYDQEDEMEMEQNRSEGIRL